MRPSPAQGQRFVCSQGTSSVNRLAEVLTGTLIDGRCNECTALDSASTLPALLRLTPGVLVGRSGVSGLFCARPANCCRACQATPAFWSCSTTLLFWHRPGLRHAISSGFRHRGHMRQQRAGVSRLHITTCPPFVLNAEVQRRMAGKEITNDPSLHALAGSMRPLKSKTFWRGAVDLGAAGGNIFSLLWPVLSPAVDSACSVNSLTFLCVSSELPLCGRDRGLKNRSGRASQSANDLCLPPTRPAAPWRPSGLDPAFFCRSLTALPQQRTIRVCDDQKTSRCSSLSAAISSRARGWSRGRGCGRA